jgi:hypothetical protein
LKRIELNGGRKLRPPALIVNPVFLKIYPVGVKKFNDWLIGGLDDLLI